MKKRPQRGRRAEAVLRTAPTGAIALSKKCRFEIGARPKFQSGPSPLQGNLFGWLRPVRRTNRFVRLDEDVVVVGLFSGKKADGYKRSARQQSGQHDPLMGAHVGVVK